MKKSVGEKKMTRNRVIYCGLRLDLVLADPGGYITPDCRYIRHKREQSAEIAGLSNSESPTSATN